MGFKLVIWHCCTLFISLSEGTLTTEGTRFIMYFTEGSQVVFPPSPLNIYITTKSQTSVTVTISSPIWTDPNSLNKTLQVTSDSPGVVAIPSSLRSSEIGRESKAILLEASDLISVFGLNPSQNQAGLFAVLPTSSLGTKYIFPSFTQFNIPSQGFIGIVTEHDQTSMSVILPASQEKQMATIRGIPYKPGQTIRGTLNRFEISEIRQDPNCPRCDLSGSIIVASKPVAVFSTISLSSPLNKQDGGDLLVEQLVPVSSWGKTYVTMTSPDNAYGTTVRVMSGDSNVTVYQSDMTSFSLQEPGQYKDINLPAGTNLMLQGSKNLQVIQYAAAAPFMLMVTSLEHYSHRAHVPVVAIDTTSKVSQLHKIVIMARVCDTTHITVNGTQVSSIAPWRSMGSTGFMVVDITVTHPSFHRIQGEPGHDVTFGGYVYGKGDITAYAAPLAMEGNKVVETFPWAQQSSIDMHTANLARTDGITQQSWRLVEKDVMLSRPAIKTLSVTSFLVCFDQCLKNKNCKYVSVVKSIKGKQTCHLFDDSMKCGPRVSMPGARIYTSRI